MVNKLVTKIVIQKTISEFVQTYFLSQSPKEYFTKIATKIGTMICLGKFDLFGINNNNEVVTIVKMIVDKYLFILYCYTILYE